MQELKHKNWYVSKFYFSFYLFEIETTFYVSLTVTMVSTRGVRVKFSEGERVLCYEPDPTKAKVLYDSKVLEVVYNKDNKGRKQVEYLIHFQVWKCLGTSFWYPK